MKSSPIRSHPRHPLASPAGIVASIGLLCLSLSAQTTLKPRGEMLPQPAKLRTLSVRESTLASILTDASAVYRKAEASLTFVLESSTGEPSLEWKIGGEEHPLPEGANAPAPGSGKQLKLIPHQGRLFLRIESITKPAPGQEGNEIRFSGTYEATVLEGSWDAYRDEGKALKFRITAADHDRYLGEMRRALFDEATLARHAARHREQLTRLLEEKVADPGTAPAPEVEMVRALLALVKTHPETLVVSVTAAFEAEPEIFVIEGDTIRSTTARQASILRFDAKLPALAPGRP